MNQIKIGNFIKELRKERKLTQEQLAEQFGVARRTVSRWETGSNMPDLDILIEMADFFDVDLREIFDGERNNPKMNDEIKETVLKVAEYNNEEKKRSTKTVLICFILGIIALITNFAMAFMELPDNILTGFFEGITIGIAIGSMITGILYATGTLTKACAFKRRLMGKDGMYER